MPRSGPVTTGADTATAGTVPVASGSSSATVVESESESLWPELPGEDLRGVPGGVLSKLRTMPCPQHGQWNRKGDGDRLYIAAVEREAEQ